MAIHHTSVLVTLLGRRAAAAAGQPSTQQEERRGDRRHGKHAVAGVASVRALDDVASASARELVEARA
jgi:hypothetical protein